MAPPKTDCRWRRGAWLLRSKGVEGAFAAQLAPLRGGRALDTLAAEQGTALGRAGGIGVVLLDDTQSRGSTPGRTLGGANLGIDRASGLAVGLMRGRHSASSSPSHTERLVQPVSAAISTEGYHLGELSQAEALHVEALALARRLGRTNLEAFQLGNLGNVARRKGNLAQAKALHRQALALKRGLGARRQIAITLEDLAAVFAAEGEGRRSARLLGAAAQIRAEIGTPQVLSERSATEQAVAEARANLGEDAWAAAFREGQSLSLDRIVKVEVGEDT